MLDIGTKLCRLAGQGKAWGLPHVLRLTSKQGRYACCVPLGGPTVNPRRTCWVAWCLRLPTLPVPCSQETMCWCASAGMCMAPSRPCNHAAHALLSRFPLSPQPSLAACGCTPLPSPNARSAAAPAQTCCLTHWLRPPCMPPPPPLQACPFCMMC